MMDRKASNLLLGLGGAYFDLCHFSKEDFMDIKQIEEGFEITRDIASMHGIFEDLGQKDGTVRKKNDYDTRAGLTTKPIATTDVLSGQVLHALLQTFDHFMTTAVHLRTAV